VSALALTGLTKRYDDGLLALCDFDLEIPEGSFFGLLGPNGAGKTTTIKMLTGLLSPSAGSIRLCGVDLAADPRAAKALTGYVPDRPELFPYLSSRETLRLVAGLYGLDASQAAKRAEGLLEAFALLPWVDEPVGGYSHGMKQKLAICCALLPGPKVIILDEPMVGLDPQGGRQVKDLLRRLAARGLTVFLSIHTLEVAERLCDRLGILLNGRLVAEGSIDEVRSSAGLLGGGLEEAFLALTGEEMRLDDKHLFGEPGA
jgi:ABC-2 type transport system ATP-binding protein